MSFRARVKCINANNGRHGAEIYSAYRSPNADRVANNSDELAATATGSHVYGNLRANKYWKWCTTITLYCARITPAASQVQIGVERTFADWFEPSQPQSKAQVQYRTSEALRDSRQAQNHAPSSLAQTSCPDQALPLAMKAPRASCDQLQATTPAFPCESYPS